MLTVSCATLQPMPTPPKNLSLEERKSQLLRIPQLQGHLEIRKTGLKGLFLALHGDFILWPLDHAYVEIQSFFGNPGLTLVLNPHYLGLRKGFEVHQFDLNHVLEINDFEFPLPLKELPWILLGILPTPMPKGLTCEATPEGHLRICTLTTQADVHTITFEHYTQVKSIMLPDSIQFSTKNKQKTESFHIILKDLVLNKERLDPSLFRL